MKSIFKLTTNHCNGSSGFFGFASSVVLPMLTTRWKLQEWACCTTMQNPQWWHLYRSWMSYILIVFVKAPLQISLEQFSASTQHLLLEALMAIYFDWAVISITYIGEGNYDYSGTNDSFGIGTPAGYTNFKHVALGALVCYQVSKLTILPCFTFA